MKSLITGILKTNMKYVGLLAVLVLLTTHAFGVGSCVWNGPAFGGTWTTGPWTAGCTGASGIPGSGDAVTFNGTNTNSVSINTTVPASGSLASLTITSAYTGTISVASGGFSSNTGTLNAANVTISGGGTVTVSGDTGTINASGAFSETGSGTLSQTGGTFNVVFNGGAGQTYTGGGTVTGAVNYTVNSGSTVALATSGSLGSSTGTFTVSSGGTLNTTSVALTGTNTLFTLASGGTLVIGNSAGITTTGATGSIQTTGTRTYTAGANYIYDSGGTQAAGNGLYQNTPAGSLTVNISGTLLNLTAGTGLTVTNAITVTAGTLNQGCTADTLTAGSLTLQSNGTYLACNAAAAGATNLTITGSGAISVDSTSTFTYVGTGTLTTRSGGVSNAGVFEVYGSAATNPPACTSPLATITSTATSIPWTGAGQFKMVDLSVKNQAGTPTINCLNCTNVSGNGSNWHFTSSCAGVTLVTFNSLTATPCDGGVLVEWRTGYESDNLGYHVYREDGGQRVRLDPSLVAGSALLAGPNTVLPAGNSHSWFDPAGTANSRYLVEEVSLSGVKTEHGPADVNAGGAAASTIAQRLLAGRASSSHPLLSQLGRAAGNSPSFAPRALEARAAATTEPTSGQINEQYALAAGPAIGLAAAATEPTSAQINKQYALAAGQAVKLGVQSEGWYHVDVSQLTAAGMPAGVNPHTLQLFLNGQQQDIVVEGQNTGQVNAIDFYGVGLNSTFSGTEVYWLVWGSGSGSRVQSTNRKGGGSAPASFQATLEWQPRTLYFPALLNGDADNFFGPVLDADDPVTQPLTLTSLNPGTPGSSTLQVTMQGVTAGPHLVAVSLNGTEVGTLSFNDQANFSSTFTVLNSLLVAGANSLALAAENGANDITLVDTVLLSYPHSYAAESDYLRFTAAAASPVTIGGFSNNQIQVFDITDAAKVESVQGSIASQGSGFAVSFAPPGQGTRTLLALTTAQEGQPVSITANNPSSWHKAQAGADMVIISHADFISSLGPLTALRQSQGHTVAVIGVQDLYDEFNFGDQSPYALKTFLSTAAAKWKKIPRWVLLVGDATYDPHNYLGTGLVDYVPVELVDTTQIETADDDWFADFGNTGIPSMAVGRLPATSAAEASTLVNKIVSYEQAGAQPWKNNVLLVAGASDSDNNFDGNTAAVKALLPASVTVQTILEDQDGNARNDLLGALNAGQGLVSYMGHGSTEVWSAGGLLSSTDATGLTNGSTTPFVLAMTCLNGYFQDVFTFALAKALMEAPGGGAVGVWASSGLTNSLPQSALEQAMIQGLYSGQSLTVGEAAVNAKKAITDPDVRRSWILFADPAMKLH